MTNLQNKKAQIEIEIAKLQHELVQVEAQILAEENEITVPKTRKEILEKIGFVSITESLLNTLKLAKQTADVKKFSEWIENNEYFGVYERDNKIIFNTPRGADLLYIKKVIFKLTGKEMKWDVNPIRENNELFSIWKSLDQWSVKDSGEN